MMRMWLLERACELELIARSMNAEPVLIDDYVIQKAAERMRKRRGADEYGLMEWRGLVRTVDRKGADYRR
jgi:ribulose-5-phosphate 4-epimerase/fuculose-1-phosphate aldolase